MIKMVFSSKTIRYLLRLILGTFLGMLMGTEMYVYGFSVITSPAILIPLLILYAFLFAIADDFIVRFKLKDRDLFFLGAIFAILIDGITNQLFYETDPAAKLITFFGLNIGSMILDSLAWGIYYIWVMHLMNKLLPRKGESSKLRRRGWIGILLAVIVITNYYFSTNFKIEHIPTDLILLVIACCISIYFYIKIKNRSDTNNTVIEQSQLLNFISVSFVILGFFVTLFGLQNVFTIPLHLLLALLLFFPATLILLRKQRVAI